ncbi:MAG: cupin domain-containing protein, partial [Rhodothermales bacterium]
MTGIWGWAAAALLFVTACGQPEGDSAASAYDAAVRDTMGYVMFPDDGEVLVPCREESSADARWVIKADPQTTGSTRLAMGTQTLPGGELIPVHRHEHQDEILFIHEGRATGVFGDSSVAVGPGTTVYVP